MSDSENLSVQPSAEGKEPLATSEPPLMPSTSSSPTSGGLYSTPQEALKAVRDSYDYWTGKLTESSFQLSIATIAANWAVFGSRDSLLKNDFARASIGVALLSLCVSLLGAKIIGEANDKIIEYAESDTKRWQEEFDANLSKNVPWPFTKSIKRTAKFLRGCKTWLPLASGVLFVLALFD